jgi:citrate lyase subunit beta/citryl-CoA lyase
MKTFMAFSILTSIINRRDGLLMKNIAHLARTLLFVPAERLDRLSKALASGAHMVIVDLEDAVAPAAKAAARAALAVHWQSLDPAARTRMAVRINAAGTPWHADDLDLLGTLCRNGLAAAMLPKIENAGQLVAIAAAVPSLPLLPLVESAEGLAAVHAIARVAQVARLVFGHLDFQLDLGLQCEADERELDAARLALSCASRRAGLPGPVDGITPQIGHPDKLLADTQRARRFGCTGKLCIHPSQVSAVSAALGPSAAQVAWAERVLAAEAKTGAGAFQLDGAMVDAPMLARAKSFLSNC